MIQSIIKSQMDIAYDTLDSQKFINEDPVQIVHQILEKPHVTMADVEICAMWTAIIAWGQREQIIKTATHLMKRCEWQPAAFIKGGDFYDIPDQECIYRTLKGKEFKEICQSLKNTYNRIPFMAFHLNARKFSLTHDLFPALCECFAPARLGSPARNSACKRINMLLRWMIRKDNIDLGFWATPRISPADLYAILDTHVAQQAQKMGLISYPKESWKAVLELTHAYRSWDAKDPLKYDLVLMTNNFKK